MQYSFLLVYSLIALVKSTLVILVYGVRNINAERTVDHKQNGCQWLPQCIADTYLGITEEALSWQNLCGSSNFMIMINIIQYRQ